MDHWWKQIEVMLVQSRQPFERSFVVMLGHLVVRFLHAYKWPCLLSALTPHKKFGISHLSVNASKLVKRLTTPYPITPSCASGPAKRPQQQQPHPSVPTASSIPRPPPANPS